MKRRKRERVEEEEGVIKRTIWGGRASYCFLKGGKGIGKWWENRIGRIEDVACPRCGEEDGPHHVPVHENQED